MPYQPSVNDRSGEILGNANAQAAAIRAQGTAQFAQALSNSVNTAAGMFMQQQQKANENKMTSDYLDGMANNLSTTYRPGTETPYMTSDELEKFSKASLGAKQGMLAPKQALYDQDLKNTYLNLQMQGYFNRMGAQAGYQAAANQPAPNQVPMSASAPPATSTTPMQSTSPTFGAGIQTRPAY